MQVGLFISCLINSMRPSIGIATLRLLQSAGVEVVVPTEQNCCGQPAYNSGYSEQAKEFARRTIEQFSSSDYIVVPSGSCAGMLSHHYPQLLYSDETQEELEHIRAFSSKVVEFTVFLNDIIQWTPKQKNLFKQTVTYHDSCAGLRELGIKSQPRQLLEACGIKIHEMKDSHECCGFGGTFSIKYTDISTRMAENKINCANASEADILVMGDLGCMLNIEGRLTRLQDNSQPPFTQPQENKLQVLHIAEVLAQAEGLV